MNAAAPKPSETMPGSDPGFPARFERALKTLFPRIGPETLKVFLSDEADLHFRRAGLLTTTERMATFLAQIGHESAGLTKRVENLSYSAAGIVKTWPTRFDKLVEAMPYARNAEALANKVYGGRYGNTAPGDGWRYRARSYIGVTFKDNYAVMGDELDLPLVEHPELAEQPDIALAIACAWWRLNGLNGWADTGDFKGQTRKINGGLNGYDDRLALLVRARKLLNV